MDQLDNPRFWGTVVSFHNVRGFGFIHPDIGHNDVFFYYTHLEMEGFKTVNPSARVSFELGQNHKGPMAIKIVIEDPGEDDDSQTA